MILIDTTVLSEVLKPVPFGLLCAGWPARRPQEMFTTTITQAEIFYGIESLPDGKRRTRLTAAVEKIFAEESFDRILPFDEDTARCFAKIVAARDAAGRPISQFDAMIAAIARSRGMALATRNTADFERCGIQIINPWRS